MTVIPNEVIFMPKNACGKVSGGGGRGGKQKSRPHRREAAPCSGPGEGHVGEEGWGKLAFPVAWPSHRGSGQGLLGWGVWVGGSVRRKHWSFWGPALVRA